MPHSIGTKYSTKGISETAEQIPYFNEAGRGKTLLHIINLARFNPGIIGLMGEEGSGRSLLVQKLTERVNLKQGLVATISRNVKTKTDLYEAIADCFSIETTDGESPEFIEQRIGDFLNTSLAQYRPVILAIDDIQKFSLSMLEFLIKLLGTYKRVSLVLVGDNNLAEMLKHLDTGHLACHVTSLQPLSTGEVHQFVTWRLAKHLKDEEFESLVSTTKGNMALLEGEMQKYEQNQKNNTRKKISFSLALKSEGQKRIRITLMIVLALSVAGGGVMYYLQMPSAPKVKMDHSEIADNEVASPAAEVGTPAEHSVDEKKVEPDVVETTTVPVTLKESVPDPIVPEQPGAVAEKIPPVQKPVKITPVTPADIDVQKPRAVKAIEEKVPVALVPGDDDSTLLSSLPPTDYSIQVLGTQSKKMAQGFIASHSGKAVMYYFRSERDGKEWYTVIYGVYSTRQEALQAAAGLPEDIKKTSPWARRLSEIQAMIEARPAH